MLLGAASAGATTFCVGKPECVTAGGTPQATLQDAIVAANAAANPDRIEIGPGTFPGPTASTFQPVDIIGAGATATAISGVAGPINTLWMTGAGPSSVSALRIDMDNGDTKGLNLSPTVGQSLSAANIVVNGAAAPAGASGVDVENNATLSDSTI